MKTLAYPVTEVFTNARRRLNDITSWYERDLAGPYDLTGQALDIAKDKGHWTVGPRHSTATRWTIMGAVALVSPTEPPNPVLEPVVLKVMQRYATQYRRTLDREARYRICCEVLDGCIAWAKDHAL